MYITCNTSYHTTPMDTHNHPVFYEPRAYSFHMVSQHSGRENYYYTCPAEATRYYDEIGIDAFIRSKLKRNRRRWIWIIDMAMCGFKHLRQSNVNSAVLNLIEEELILNRLKNIVVVNQTMTSKFALFTFWCRTPYYIRKLVIFDTNHHFTQLLKLDDKLQILHDTLHYN